MRDEKARLADRIAMIKREKGLTWKTLADHAGQSPVWTCALCRHVGRAGAGPGR